MGKINTFDGGTDGTTITLANSTSSGDAFGVAPQPTSGNMWFYSVSANKRGGLGARRVLDTTAGYLRLDVTTPSGRTGGGAWFYIPAVVTATSVLVQFRDASDVLMYNIVYRSTGVFTHAPSGTTNTSVGSPVVTTPGWYHLEAWLTPGATAGTGTAQIVVRDSTWTEVWNHTLSGNANLATTNPAARVRFGGSGSTSTGWTNMDMDDVRVDQLTSGTFPELTALLPPSSIAATPASATQINLTWTAASGATGYDVERDSVVIATNHAASPYNDTGLSPGTSYSYRVRSRN